MEIPNNTKEEKSEREDRIRKITKMYYSRPEIQKAIFEFSKNRETIPRYFEGFGKRPDSVNYPNELLELVKKGANVKKNQLKLQIYILKLSISFCM